MVQMWTVCDNPGTIIQNATTRFVAKGRYYEDDKIELND